MLYPNTHALLYTLSIKGWTGSTPVNNATSPIQMKHGLLTQSSARCAKLQTHFIGIHFCAHIVSLTYRSRALIGRNMCSSFPPHVAHLFDLDDVDDDVLGEIELLKHEAKIETTDTIRTK